MTRRLRIGLASLLLPALAACASITKAPAGPIALGAGRSGVLDRDWSDISAITPWRTPSVQVLSVDGPLLNRLYIARGLKPGEGLQRPAEKEKPVPVYRAGMSPNEQIEFITDSLGILGFQRAETTDLRPARLMGADAIRIDLAAKTESGLEISGAAEVAEIEGRLYVLLFLAPSEHYFRAYLPNVEAMFRSAG